MTGEEYAVKLTATPTQEPINIRKYPEFIVTQNNWVVNTKEYFDLESDAVNMRSTVYDLIKQMLLDGERASVLKKLIILGIQDEVLRMHGFSWQEIGDMADEIFGYE